LETTNRSIADTRASEAGETFTGSRAALIQINALSRFGDDSCTINTPSAHAAACLPWRVR